MEANLVWDSEDCVQEREYSCSVTAMNANARRHIAKSGV